MIKKNINIAIIGAGQMGSGIAQIFATNGFSVKLLDISIDQLKLSKKKILRSLKKLNEKKMLNEDPEIIFSRILYYCDYNELRGSDVFIESAFEDILIKQEIFKKLSDVVDEKSFVASNTSSYSITKLSKMLPWPERFIGFHFMNPPPLMELLEVIKGLYTDQNTSNFFMNLAKKIGKTPIESRNSPGFTLNRILIPMINEAICVLNENVASAEEIDKAMMLGANHPIGPLSLGDLIGLDTVLAIMNTLYGELREKKYAPSPLLENYVAQGRLGKKTKIGIFKY